MQATFASLEPWGAGDGKTVSLGGNVNVSWLPPQVVNPNASAVNLVVQNATANGRGTTATLFPNFSAGTGVFIDYVELPNGVIWPVKGNPGDPTYVGYVSNNVSLTYGGLPDSGFEGAGTVNRNDPADPTTGQGSNRRYVFSVHFVGINAPSEYAVPVECFGAMEIYADSRITWSLQQAAAASTLDSAGIVARLLANGQAYAKDLDSGAVSAPVSDPLYSTYATLSVNDTNLLKFKNPDNMVNGASYKVLLEASFLSAVGDTYTATKEIEINVSGTITYTYQVRAQDWSDGIGNFSLAGVKDKESQKVAYGSSTTNVGSAGMPNAIIKVPSGYSSADIKFAGWYQGDTLITTLTDLSAYKPLYNSTVDANNATYEARFMIDANADGVDDRLQGSYRFSWPTAAVTTVTYNGSAVGTDVSGLSTYISTGSDGRELAELVVGGALGNGSAYAFKGWQADSDSSLPLIGSPVTGVLPAGSLAWHASLGSGAIHETSTIINPIGYTAKFTYKATINTKLDDQLYAANPNSYILVSVHTPDNRYTLTPDSLTGIASAYIDPSIDNPGYEQETYQVLQTAPGGGSHDTGYTLSLAMGQANALTLEYYTARVDISEAGSAAGSTVALTYSWPSSATTVQSGAVLLAGHQLTLAATARTPQTKGATTYAYTWAPAADNAATLPTGLSGWNSGTGLIVNGSSTNASNGKGLDHRLSLKLSISGATVFRASDLTWPSANDISYPAMVATSGLSNSSTLGYPGGSFAWAPGLDQLKGQVDNKGYNLVYSFDANKVAGADFSAFDSAALNGPGLYNASAHTITKTVELIVQPVNISDFTWPAQTDYPYNGGKAITLVSPQSSDFVGGDDISFSVSGDSGTSVGSYTARITGLAGSDRSNYSYQDAKDAGAAGLSFAWNITTSKPNVPVLAQPVTSAGSGSISLSWTPLKAPEQTGGKDLKTVGGYVVQYSTNQAFPSTAATQTISDIANTARSYDIITTAATYYVRMKAVNVDDQSSDWSRVFTVDMAKATPVIFGVDANGYTLTYPAALSGIDLSAVAAYDPSDVTDGVLDPGAQPLVDGTWEWTVADTTVPQVSEDGTTSYGWRFIPGQSISGRLNDAIVYPRINVVAGTLDVTPAVGTTAVYNAVSHDLAVLPSAQKAVGDPDILNPVTVRYGYAGDSTDTSGSTGPYNGTYPYTSAPTRVDAGLTTVYWSVSSANYATVTGAAAIDIAPLPLDLTYSGYDDGAGGSIIYDGFAHNVVATINNVQGNDDVDVVFTPGTNVLTDAASTTAVIEAITGLSANTTPAALNYTLQGATSTNGNATSGTDALERTMAIIKRTLQLDWTGISFDRPYQKGDTSARPVNQYGIETWPTLVNLSVPDQLSSATIALDHTSSPVLYGFADDSATTGKAVTQLSGSFGLSGRCYGGADAGDNYTLDATPAPATANIHKLVASVTWPQVSGSLQYPSTLRSATLVGGTTNAGSARAEATAGWSFAWSAPQTIAQYGAVANGYSMVLSGIDDINYDFGAYGSAYDAASHTLTGQVAVPVIRKTVSYLAWSVDGVSALDQPTLSFDLPFDGEEHQVQAVLSGQKNAASDNPSVLTGDNLSFAYATGSNTGTSVNDYEAMITGVSGRGAMNYVLDEDRPLTKSWRIHRVAPGVPTITNLDYTGANPLEFKLGWNQPSFTGGSSIANVMVEYSESPEKNADGSYRNPQGAYPGVGDNPDAALGEDNHTFAWVAGKHYYAHVKVSSGSGDDVLSTWSADCEGRVGLATPTLVEPRNKLTVDYGTSLGQVDLSRLVAGSSPGPSDYDFGIDWTPSSGPAVPQLLGSLSFNQVVDVDGKVLVDGNTVPTVTQSLANTTWNLTWTPDAATDIGDGKTSADYYNSVTIAAHLEVKPIAMTFADGYPKGYQGTYDGAFHDALDWGAITGYDGLAIPKVDRTYSLSGDPDSYSQAMPQFRDVNTANPVTVYYQAANPNYLPLAGSIQAQIDKQPLSLDWTGINFNRNFEPGNLATAPRNAAGLEAWPALKGLAATDLGNVLLDHSAVSYAYENDQVSAAPEDKTVVQNGSYVLQNAAGLLWDASDNYLFDGSPQAVGILRGTVLALLPAIAAPVAPAAVTLGAAPGPGVSLRLQAPAVNWGGGTPLAFGWESNAAGAWMPFDPATLMNLSYNGKQLRYYARNATGTGYSQSVSIRVLAPSVYPTLGGANRIETSRLTALDAWPEGSKYAVLAIGSDFKDALAASYLVGHLDAPVLLVSPQLKNNAPIKQTLKDLKVTKVYTVGAAVTDTIRRSVWTGTFGKVSPQGKDGVTEAIDIVKYVTGTLKKAKPTSVLITTTSGFADAMGTAAYAANPKLNMPILYVNGKNDASKASAYVKSLGTVKTTYVLGSTVSVSASAASKFSGVKRVYGADRNATAAAAFATFSPMVAKANADGKLHSVGMAAASGFADALGAGAAQAHLGGVVMITPPAKVGANVKAVLNGATFKSGNTTYKPVAIHKHLTNFCFYGLTMSTAVKKTISGYIR